MIWWNYVIPISLLSLNVMSIGLNMWGFSRYFPRMKRIDELIQRAKLLGYQQGYRDGSKT